MPLNSAPSAALHVILNYSWGLRSYANAVILATVDDDRPIPSSIEDQAQQSGNFSNIQVADLFVIWSDGVVERRLAASLGRSAVQCEEILLNAKPWQLLHADECRADLATILHDAGIHAPRSVLRRPPQVVHFTFMRRVFSFS